MSSPTPPPPIAPPAAAPPAGAAPRPALGPRPPAKPRLGDELVKQGVITAEQLSGALAEQRRSSRKLGELLIEQGVINSTLLVHTLARCLGVPGCQLRHGLIDPQLLKLIGAEEAERLAALPMFRVRGVLTVAMAEPQSLPAIDRLRQLTGCRIRPVLALEANIVEFIKKYASGDVDVDAFLTQLAEQDVEVIERESVDEGPTTDLDRLVAGSPIINLVNVALLTAVRDKASDIHIEPDKRGTRVRYRVDGALRDLMKPPAGMHASIVSRIKVIGKMDIAEKRLPQEGRVRIVAEGREIDLRVSSMPTLLGEKIVVRILDKSNLRIRLSDLGFRPGALEVFSRVLKKPNGLVLVTGPTGSGKTTTLYSALDLLRSPETNILTVEDPVEYQLDLINQIQVNDAIGLTFARALRSILRQDPDVIMVGEIRDQETARVGMQAALTGHLVLATLHTNDAPGAVARLNDMGIEPYLLASALNGVVAQRLTRTICPACATKYYPSENVLGDAGLKEHAGRPFRKGAGCKPCHDSGFRGRIGVYEVMEVTPDLRRLIHAGAPTHDLRNKIRSEGMLTLREEGIHLALEGKTSLEEILRVTAEEEEHPGLATAKVGAPPPAVAPAPDVAQGSPVAAAPVPVATTTPERRAAA
ncbi:type IV-A pilus assembly ATPase PilB [soil metagenome]